MLLAKKLGLKENFLKEKEIAELVEPGQGGEAAFRYRKANSFSYTVNFMKQEETLLVPISQGK